MEMNLSKSFCEMLPEEEELVEGGGVVAAVYALGFVMGMSPLGALVVCGTCIVGGVATAVVVNMTN